MNHTETEILAKSKVILKNFHGKYFNESNIEKVFYSSEKELIRGTLETIPAWIVVINEPVFGSLEFLIISDVTGEPLYIQSKHLVCEIIRNPNGDYDIKR